jgi:hypothetical protein
LPRFIPALIVLVTGCVACGRAADAPPPAAAQPPAAAPAAAPNAAPATACRPSLPEIPTGNRPPGLEARLVDPAPAYWGVMLGEGDPLPLDSSVELEPMHVRVAHRFDPQIQITQSVDAQIYLIFPRNDFIVKPPKTGWVEEPGSDANVVYCGEVHGKPALAPGEHDSVFWITALAARPFPIQWQLAGTAEVGPLSTRLRGFTVDVTP